MTYTELKGTAGICPKCGSDDLDYSASEIQEECCGYPVKCLSCKWEGKEWYSLVFDNFSEEST